MSFLKNNLKRKLNKVIDSKPSPLYIYGSSLTSNILEQPTERTIYISKRIKNIIEKLKKTAVTLRLNSLSCNQIYDFESIFIIHKDVNQSMSWYNNGKTKIEDYQTYINPEITWIKKELEKSMELCSSFPFLKANIKRFSQIKISYYNEEFEEISDEIINSFQARVFQHEYDHIIGKMFIDWRVSQGEIEVLSTAIKDYEEFNKVLTKYKKLISEVKKSHPEIFDYYEKKEYLGEDTDGWYKYNLKNFRGQKYWSKEIEILEELKKTANIAFNYTMVLNILKKFDK